MKKAISVFMGMLMIALTIGSTAVMARSSDGGDNGNIGNGGGRSCYGCRSSE